MSTPSNERSDILHDPELSSALAFIAVLIFLIVGLGIISHCTGQDLPQQKEDTMPKGPNITAGMSDSDRAVIERHEAAKKVSGNTASALNKVRENPTERRESEALVTAVNALYEHAGSDYRLVLVGKDGKPLTKAK